MRSLELNWLRWHDRHLAVPEVVFVESGEFSGQYREPEESEHEIDGRFYDARFGIIVVNAAFRDSIPATLAHEWRHHWQRYNLPIVDGADFSAIYTDDCTYEDAIKKYFAASPCELDALRFEARVAPTCTSDYWLSLIS